VVCADVVGIWSGKERREAMGSEYTAAIERPDGDVMDGGFLGGVVRGEIRLTPEQAMRLLGEAPLTMLGRFADARCRALHGDTLRTYVIDRNINYTNVCTAKCTFCAFRRDLEDADAYTLSYEELYEKIEHLRTLGGTQILMQGGMNPELPLDWYLDLLRGIKERYPEIHVHAFSPPELVEFVRFFQPPGDGFAAQVRWVLERLQEAGMDSLPGGGGEIFAAPVRRKIGLGKCDAEAWLTCMYVAHSLGMFTSGTMMFGHIEGYADRIHHMGLIREWQDRALRDFGMGTERLDGTVCGGGQYMAFISWPFQPENTPLGRVKEWGSQAGELEEGSVFPGDVVASLLGDGDAKADKEFGRRIRLAGSTDYLRTQAVSRLFLDNVYSVGSSWVTMGPHIGQVGLYFGANDMGSVMVEENVVSSAGTTYCLDESVLCRLIRDAGFVPAQRDNTYDILSVKDGPGAPDRAVEDWSTHRAERLHSQNTSSEEEFVSLEVSTGS
jgi:cyclic dehypoxanthinyl futalosine synthase